MTRSRAGESTPFLYTYGNKPPLSLKTSGTMVAKSISIKIKLHDFSFVPGMLAAGLSSWIGPWCHLEQIMFGLQHFPPPRWESCLCMSCKKGGPSERKLLPPRTLDVEAGAFASLKQNGTKGSGCRVLLGLHAQSLGPCYNSVL